MKVIVVVTLVFTIAAVYASSTYPRIARIGTATSEVQSDAIQSPGGEADGSKPRKRIFITLSIINLIISSIAGTVTGAAGGLGAAASFKAAWESLRLGLEAVRGLIRHIAEPCGPGTKCYRKFIESVDSVMPDACHDKDSWEPVAPVCTKLEVLRAEIRAIKNTLNSGN